MPQFPKRSTLPLQPESYRAAARRLRRIADKLEARAAPRNPIEKTALSNIVNNLYHTSRRLWCRHTGRPIWQPPSDL